MVKLFLTSAKTTPEFIYKEYVPYFDWISSKNHTECWMTSDYPELFTSTNIIPNGNTKDSKKTLSILLNIPIKNIQSQVLPRASISPTEKLYKKLVEITPEENFVIPKESSFLKYLKILKNARKIVTWQEIFVYFAFIHEIPCLAFYNDWNPNQFKGIKDVTILPGSSTNKTKTIDEFLKV